ncbi:uncharacterized protein LOC124657222 [Lolium rigidum]|uniref:uncharacterized protein LOC124657222 n=1 Tax=Lolium rigidum TaxID=89674 RepID=UPI001F5C93F8|nr:uncharacterized protein LOC124657222 [Lolium rigidum]
MAAAASVASTSSRFSRMCISEQRIYGPRTLDDEAPIVPIEERDELRSELLGKIDGCYQQAKLRGGVVADAGFCFGLLDPVSNIVAGVIIASAAVVKADPDPAVVQRKPGLAGNVEQRSLDGLVAFLAALFPHLNEARAMWYLCKADLDPLVAARLVVHHRGMEQSFGFTSDATVAAVETALRCAAAAAQHPSPKQFASGWKLLSHFLERVAAVISGPCAAVDQFQSIAIKDILVMEPQTSGFSLEKSWELASSRILKLSPDPFVRNKVNVFPDRSTVRRVLLTTIHGYYLQALSRLPKEGLRSQYHHSLLHAGHCYGPLDPVSNIILNTIWYSRAFPLEKKVDLEAINSKGLLRIAVRSFYGLLSFLCTRCATDNLSPDEAMQRLQAAGADLRIADPNLLDDYNNDDDMVSASVEQAYVAAATAALHPKPHDQAQLLGPSNKSMPRVASDYLKDGGHLSQVDADHLAESLFSFSGSERPETTIKVVNRPTYTSMEQLTSKFWNHHAEVVRTVKSLLDGYSLQHGVPKYELHVICGVNERVNGPVYTAPFKGTFGCSHVNFLATQSADTPPTLFFAEFHNDGGTQERGLCCPVDIPPPGTEQVRCLYCEYVGTRIVHPSRGSFHGSGIEFEKMWGGEKLYSHSYNNDVIIMRSLEATLWVDYLEDDCIYNTYRLDDKHIGVKASIKKVLLDKKSGWH